MRLTVFTPTLAALLTSVLVGCASTDHEQELEKRAGYNLPPLPKAAIGIGQGGFHYVPTRVPERVAVAWLFPHELSPKEYFWGAWLSVTLAPEGWEMMKIPAPKNAKSLEPRAPEKPLGAKPRKRLRPPSG